VNLTITIATCIFFNTKCFFYRYASLLGRTLAGSSLFTSVDLSKVGKAGKGANVKPKEVLFFFLPPPLFSGTFFKAGKNG
jgi:hypothetical protein